MLQDYEVTLNRLLSHPTLLGKMQIFWIDRKIGFEGHVLKAVPKLFKFLTV